MKDAIQKKSVERDTNETYSVDIYGSCVSRAVLLEGDVTKKGSVEPRININYFFDKHPILSCMTPVPNTEILNENIINNITSDELWDKSTHNLRGIKQELLKVTLPMIRESKANYFIFDLYDFHTNLLIYDHTLISPYKYESFNTRIYQNNKQQFNQLFFPLELPLGLWYGYVKLFMDEVFAKYGKENVIMLRFNACSHYLTKDKKVCEIPKNFLNPWMANYRFNERLRMLEDRIIEDYSPQVIDLSKYYIGDESFITDLQGAHFSEGYYLESMRKLREIILDKKDMKWHSAELSFTAISNIFMMDIENEEFKKMWKLIEPPFSGLEKVF